MFNSTSSSFFVNTKLLFQDPESGFTAMLKQSGIIGLKRVYTLTVSIPNGHKEINKRLDPELQGVGLDIVQSTDHSNESGNIFVEVLIV